MIQSIPKKLKCEVTVSQLLKTDVEINSGDEQSQSPVHQWDAGVIPALTAQALWFCLVSWRLILLWKSTLKTRVYNCVLPTKSSSKTLKDSIEAKQRNYIKLWVFTQMVLLHSPSHLPQHKVSDVEQVTQEGPAVILLTGVHLCCFLNPHLSQSVL